MLRNKKMARDANVPCQKLQFLIYFKNKSVVLLLTTKIIRYKLADLLMGQNWGSNKTNLEASEHTKMDRSKSFKEDCKNN